MTEGKDETTQGPTNSGPGEMSEKEIDDNLAEASPASDPPSWTLGTNHREEPKDDGE
jgi:hypothetical protein